jgi:hypothetical protein
MLGEMPVATITVSQSICDAELLDMLAKACRGRFVELMKH